MPSHLKGRKVKPADKFNEAWDMKYVPNQAITAYQVLDVVGSTNGHLKLDLAVATDAAILSATLFVARTDAAPDGDKAVAAASKLMTAINVNTNGQSLEDPVYLTDVAGGYGFSAGTNSRVIGRVIKVGTTDGEILFDTNIA